MQQAYTNQQGHPELQKDLIHASSMPPDRRFRYRYSHPSRAGRVSRAAMSLFRREITVCSLSSGSAGNATWVGDRHAGVLIDCGLSTKKIMEGLQEKGLGDVPIDAVLVTHEHSDHVGSAGVLARHLAKKRGPVPFYMTRSTFQAAHPNSRPDGLEPIVAGEPFRVRHLRIEPIPVPHDAADPVAYRIQIGDVSVGIITDLGKPTALVGQHMKQCDVLLLEFNHDEELLLEGPYPLALKQRIRGSHGHLSNRQAQQLLSMGLGSRLKHLVLSHLSDENNRADLALSAAMDTLKEAGVPINLKEAHSGQNREGGVTIQVARQRVGLPPFRVEAREW